MNPTSAVNKPPTFSHGILLVVLGGIIGFCAGFSVSLLSNRSADTPEQGADVSSLTSRLEATAESLKDSLDVFSRGIQTLYSLTGERMESQQPDQLSGSPESEAGAERSELPALPSESGKTWMDFVEQDVGKALVENGLSPSTPGVTELLQKRRTDIDSVEGRFSQDVSILKVQKESGQIDYDRWAEFVRTRTEQLHVDREAIDAAFYEAIRKLSGGTF